MISAADRCVYVHVPKTAGQSVENFFLARQGIAWEDRAEFLLAHNPDRSRGPARLAHLTAEEYVRLGHVDPADWAAWYTFAFVRNPWARLHSEYRYRSYHERMEFKRFVFEGLPDPDPYTDAHRHIMAQTDYVYSADGTLLVDFVGRFERLQEDFRSVCSALAIEQSDLPHINDSGRRSRGGLRKRLRRLWYSNLARLGGAAADRQAAAGKPYHAYYDDETRDRVAEMYASDIAAFGYRFGD